MKILKKIAVSLAVASALTVFSAPTFAAEEHKDKNAIVRAAAEGAISKVTEAIKLSEQEGNKEALIAALGEARQFQKEFRYEQTERLRQKANEKLRLAREAVDNNDTAGANASSKEALAIFSEMKQIYDAAHK